MRALSTALLLLPLAASPAFGQGLPKDGPVVMRLQYTRGLGAEACPDEQFFRDVVMGVHVRRVEPFAPNAPRLLTVTISRRGNGYESFAELHDDATGAVVFKKAYPPTPRCIDALGDLARGVAIEIEHLATAKPQVECPAAPAPSTVTMCKDSRLSVWPAEWPIPPLPKPKADPPPPPERWPLAIRIGAATWPEVVAAGWGSLGLSADVSVRYGAISAGFEAHGDPPLGATQVHNIGEVTFARLSGALLVCAHWGLFVGCGVGDAGRFFFPNHVQKLPASRFYGAAGVRVGLDFPVAPPRIFVRAVVDMRAPIHPLSYTFKGNDVFASAGPGVGLGLGVVVEIPP